jgi:hypothetical protein
MKTTLKTILMGLAVTAIAACSGSSNTPANPSHQQRYKADLVSLDNQNYGTADVAHENGQLSVVVASPKIQAGVTHMASLKNGAAPAAAAEASSPSDLMVALSDQGNASEAGATPVADVNLDGMTIVVSRADGDTHTPIAFGTLTLADGTQGQGQDQKQAQAKQAQETPKQEQKQVQEQKPKQAQETPKQTQSQEQKQTQTDKKP